MSDSEIIVFAVLAIFLIVAIGFRKKISASWEFLGSKLEIKGENPSDPDASVVSSKSTIASGDRSVAAGGDIKGSSITTGDKTDRDTPNSPSQR